MSELTLKITAKNSVVTIPGRHIASSRFLEFKTNPVTGVVTMRDRPSLEIFLKNMDELSPVESNTAYEALREPFLVTVFEGGTEFNFHEPALTNMYGIITKQEDYVDDRVLYITYDYGYLTTKKTCNQ